MSWSRRTWGAHRFWVDPGLSLGTVLYTLGLALLGASKPQLGCTWTFLIVTQVAITVAAIPPAMLMGRHWVSQALMQPGFPSDEYLSAALLLERDGDALSDADLATPEFRNAMRATQTALVDRLENAYAVQRREIRMAALALVPVIGSVLLLSAAGMYALMSFTVSQRRREIGVRAALGADARHILTGVLARAARQLVIGVAVGLALVVVVDRLLGGELLTRTGLLVIPGTALFMAVIGMTAAAGPAKHGLRIQPTEALRSD